MRSLVPQPHPGGESLVTSSWFLGLHYKFIACYMHSWELITDLCAKKCCTIVPAEVAKNFQCCNHRLCYLQCDWQLENYLQKAINVNETWGIGWRSPSPLGWSPGMRLDHGLLKLYRGPEFDFQWPPNIPLTSKHLQFENSWVKLQVCLIAYLAGLLVVVECIDQSLCPLHLLGWGREGFHHNR